MVSFISYICFKTKCRGEADNVQTTSMPPLDVKVEMFQRGTPDPFFNMKALAPRPLSNATEMYDTEFEDDSSDIEEDYSPRISLNSVCSFLQNPNIVAVNTDFSRLVGGAKRLSHHMRTCLHQNLIISKRLIST